jgi:hypothetical protein
VTTVPVNGSSSPYGDLEPTIWRGLLARAAVFHAVRAQLARLCDAAERMDAVQLLLLELELSARRVCLEEADDERVVRLVAERCQETIAAQLPGVDEESETSHLLAEFGRLVALARGDDPFLLLFEGIQSQARQLYGAAWRRSALSVAHVGSHPRRTDLSRDPFALTAVTAWPPGPDTASVELRIFCDAFGPAAFASLPMFLIHELVCHVPARQDRARNDSQFAEGFMDWAAYHFLDLWAGKLDRELAPAARKQADRLRQVLVYGGDDKATRARQLGHHAAENLLCWFEGEYSFSCDESRTRVAMLAVQLNQADRNLDAKDWLVSQLGCRRFPPEIEAALRSWVDGRQPAERMLDLVAS